MINGFFDLINLTGLRGKPLFRDILLSWKAPIVFNEWFSDNIAGHLSLAGLLLKVLVMAIPTSVIVFFIESSKSNEISENTIFLLLFINIAIVLGVVGEEQRRKKLNHHIYITPSGIHLNGNRIKYSELMGFNIVTEKHKETSMDILLLNSKSGIIGLIGINDSFNKEMIINTLGRYLLFDEALQLIRA